MRNAGGMLTSSRAQPQFPPSFPHGPLRGWQKRAKREAEERITRLKRNITLHGTLIEAPVIKSAINKIEKY